MKLVPLLIFAGVSVAKVKFIPAKDAMETTTMLLCVLVTHSLTSSQFTTCPEGSILEDRCVCDAHSG